MRLERDTQHGIFRLEIIENSLLTAAVVISAT